MLALPIINAERREFTFTVYGVPKPQGSKTGFPVGKKDPERPGWVYRPRVVIAEARGGKSHKDLKAWRETIRLTARGAMERAGASILDGPLGLDLVFAMPRPKSIPKSRKWPSVKPDRLKLARAVEDSLQDAGLIAEDSRIVTGLTTKIYAVDRPGVTIHVWQLD